MKRGFVLTGILFGLALILLISTNYVLLAEKNTANYLVLQVDAVHNRAVDVDRIITDAIADGKCSELNALLTSNPDLNNEGGVTVNYLTLDTSSCPATPSITIKLTSENVVKYFTYSP